MYSENRPKYPQLFQQNPKPLKPSTLLIPIPRTTTYLPRCIFTTTKASVTSSFPPAATSYLSPTICRPSPRPCRQCLLHTVATYRHRLYTSLTPPPPVGALLCYQLPYAGDKIRPSDTPISSYLKCFCRFSIANSSFSVIFLNAAALTSSMDSIMYARYRLNAVISNGFVSGSAKCSTVGK